MKNRIRQFSPDALVFVACLLVIPMLLVLPVR